MRYIIVLPVDCLYMAMEAMKFSGRPVLLSPICANRVLFESVCDKAYEMLVSLLPASEYQLYDNLYGIEKKGLGLVVKDVIPKRPVGVGHTPQYRCDSVSCLLDEEGHHRCAEEKIHLHCALLEL